eukprot:GHVU01217091.1.p1 GENE.GHVU01217091.1~~GHVU01217091.1.p1  ORF type:complete len:334 (-),score=39.12 GHVU01217091.1:1701-2702(-)
MPIGYNCCSMFSMPTERNSSFFFLSNSFSFVSNKSIFLASISPRRILRRIVSYFDVMRVRPLLALASGRRRVKQFFLPAAPRHPDGFRSASLAPGLLFPSPLTRSLVYTASNTRHSKGSISTPKMPATNENLPDNLPKTAPQVLFVLGGPGAGKGTQCTNLEKVYNYKHISAGDCLREEKALEGSEYGQLIADHIKNGTIVPVAITCRLLKKKMKTLGWENGKFLIDGFPRNEDNLQGWMQEMTDVRVQACLYMDCSEGEMERRLLNRGKSSGRIDDNIESIKKRFRTFQNETMGVISWFDSKEKVIKVNAEQTPEAVWSNIQTALDRFEGAK